MKHLARLLSLLILVSAGVFFASCDGGDDPKKSAEETELNKLKGLWTLNGGTATFETEQRAFPGMTLNISGSFAAGAKYNYAVDVTDDVDASPWLAAGKWKFETPSSPTQGLIRLDSEEDSSYDDVAMDYTLSDGGETLTIEFTFEGAGYALQGRSKSVEGDWTFVFSKD